MTDEQLYKAQIIDLFKHPHNKRMIPYTHSGSKYNTTCGDSIQVYVHVQNGTILDASFQGSGCAISTASAVLMLEHIKGMTIVQAQQLNFATVKELLGVSITDSRVRCATLVLDALKELKEKV
jgi:SUF system NifU family Fe-S assembly protein